MKLKPPTKTKRRITCPIEQVILSFKGMSMSLKCDEAVELSDLAWKKLQEMKKSR